MSEIAIDYKKLASILLCEEPELPSSLRSNRNQQMAARALTDSARRAGQDPASALLNASAWIESARLEGYADGRREADREWRTKIARLFGL